MSDNQHVYQATTFIYDLLVDTNIADGSGASITQSQNKILVKDEDGSEYLITVDKIK